MRILYHHRTQGQEPESVHIDAIVGALRAMGHDVKIVSPVSEPRRSGAEERPSLLGRVKAALPGAAFEMLQIGYNAVVWARLRRAIQEYRPDLIYERHALYMFGGVLASRQAGVPLVLEVNTAYAQAWAKYFALRFQGVARLVERWTLSRADHLITVTDVMRGKIEDIGIDPSRITVSHTAVDPEVMDPARFDRTRLRGALGLQGFTVGFVGTMNRWQGIAKFFNVFDKAFARAPDLQFLMVGDGEFRAELESRCASRAWASRVRFVGRKRHSEVPDLIAAMDACMLLDSNDYGSPMKVFEYMALAKPVIAPRVAPVLEVMRDRDTALLIDPGDAEQMVDAICELHADAALRERLAQAGRAQVLRRHTWSRNAAEIVAIGQRLGSLGAAAC
jgi:glycosyltransferase involved in cell wall biosynthesis